MAAVLKISGLKYWVGRKWIKGLFTGSLDCLKEVGEKMLFGKISTEEPTNGENQEEVPDELASPVIKTPNPQNGFHSTFFQADSVEIDLSTRKEIFEKEIVTEIFNFRKLLLKDGSKIINECESTTDFWNENKKRFPKISELAKILLNINSSSAFIERFFSICGFIQDKRKGNITIEFFKMKCLLRANIKLLNELGIPEKDLESLYDDNTHQ